MIESLLIGSGFAFAAAVQPGPLLAFLFAQVVERGWRRTLPACLAPLLSDGPIALLVLLLLKRLPENAGRMLQGAGGVLLLYLAWASYRRWKRGPQTGPGRPGSAPRTLLQAAAVNALNPGPYLGWSLVLGPKVMEAWNRHPADAAVLIGAFYTTMVATMAALVFLFGTTRLLASSGRQRLVLVSAALLAALGTYNLLTSLHTGR